MSGTCHNKEKEEPVIAAKFVQNSIGHLHKAFQTKDIRYDMEVQAFVPCADPLEEL
jgi:hypothetical protein